MIPNPDSRILRSARIPLIVASAILFGLNSGCGLGIQNSEAQTPPPTSTDTNASNGASENASPDTSVSEPATLNHTLEGGCPAGTYGVPSRMGFEVDGLPMGCTKIEENVDSTPTTIESPQSFLRKEDNLILMGQKLEELKAAA